MVKIRLDHEIYRRGLTNSREKAKALVIAGQVSVNGIKIDKPGTNINEDVEILIENSPRYVSRGGYKLEKALEDFKINLIGKIVLDIGASTGGYTDCALQNGAEHIYALDVGYGQLDWKLRNNPQVTNIERMNIRNFTINDLGEKVDIITIDVSFISTKLVFPVASELIKDDGIIISLIKPQFEAGRSQVGKKGVVKDDKVHLEVLLNSIENARNSGLNCTDITFSPIKGPKGNIEYFLCLTKSGYPVDNITRLAHEVVAKAHKDFGG